MTDWLVTDGVRCVSCPDCAFTFDAMHGDQDGEYSCPVCAEADLARGIRRLARSFACVYGVTAVGLLAIVALLLPCGLRPCG